MGWGGVGCKMKLNEPGRQKSQGMPGTGPPGGGGGGKMKLNEPDGGNPRECPARGQTRRRVKLLVSDRTGGWTQRGLGQLGVLTTTGCGGLLFSTAGCRQ